MIHHMAVEAHRDTISLLGPHISPDSSGLVWGMAAHHWTASPVAIWTWFSARCRRRRCRPTTVTSHSACSPEGRVCGRPLPPDLQKSMSSNQSGRAPAIQHHAINISGNTWCRCWDLRLIYTDSSGHPTASYLTNDCLPSQRRKNYLALYWERERKREKEDGNE